jgi:hypothetical protein
MRLYPTALYCLIACAAAPIYAATWQPTKKHGEGK